MSTPVTLERYAEMRAEMDAGRLRDEVLARTGMTTDEWTDAQRGWLERMGTELERGRFELTNRYTQAFLDRQRVLETAAPPRLAVTAAPLPPAETAAPPFGAPEPFSFAPALPPPLTAASPFGPPPIAVPLPRVPLPEAAKTADDPCQTLTAPLVAVHDVLPFIKGHRDPDEPDRTPLVPRVAVLDQVLPFEKSSPYPHPPDPIAAPTDFDATATMPLDLGRLVHKDALPFKDGSPASRSAPQPQSAPRPGSGALPFVPGAAPAPAAERTHPSVDLSSQQSPEAMKRAHGISLAQYAEICASVTAFPERVVEIRSHYGMDVQAWTTLHALWQERFQRDRMLEPRWEALVEAALSRRAR